MRISIWNQFASNHSGTFVVVGSFKTAESATAAEKTLKEIISETNEWFTRPEHEAFRNLASGDAPPPIEADLIRKYNLPTTQTIGLGLDDVRQSLSISADLNLVHLIIQETHWYEEHLPLKDLFLRLGAEHAGIECTVDGELFQRVAFHVSCVVPADSQEEIETYLDELFTPEDEMGEDEFYAEYTFHEVRITDQKASIQFRSAEPPIQELQEFLQSCGCTDIRWQVEELSDPHEE